ncbi:hypothetical protein IAR55_006028 [Kwoniella newhampshirensis]|uniref:Rho-GAP domain-containing protein n=1 Tax=Kwoniella newhampshirensis TaxID=1651941 RepID=A0AAW0YUL9_9TREE
MSAPVTLQDSVTASSEASSSSQSTAPLIPTLSRLSRAASRPTLPPDADDTYASKTMRFVSRGGKEIWRRSGLSSMWRDDDGSSSVSKDSDIVTNRPSFESVASSSFSQKLRSQPLDTSSILYPTLTTHPTPIPNHMLVLSIAHINRAPPTINNDELFDILLRRLEPWVGEEGEGGYVMVILAAESPEVNAKGKDKETRKLPGIAWWVWKWKRIPRRYRKNLKRLYIVHPSLFTRTLLPFILPFISPKSYPKLHPLPSLLSLYYTHSVPLKGTDVTLPVLQAEARALRHHTNLLPATAATAPTFPRPPLKKHDSDSSIASWGFQTLSSAVGTAASYLPFQGLAIEDETEPMAGDAQSTAGYWRRDTVKLVQECGGKVPPLLVELRKVILSECTTTEGVFRRGSNSELLPPLMGILAMPIDSQPNLPWVDLARQDPLLAPKILSKFLAESTTPMIKPNDYGTVRSVATPSDIRTAFLPTLLPAVRLIIEYVVHILHHLSIHEASTKMSPLNLAIVIAPTLISGPDPLEDAEMCLEPGKSLPAAMRQLAGAQRKSQSGGNGTVVGLLEMWIKNRSAVSGRGEEGVECACSWTNERSKSIDEKVFAQTHTPTTRQNGSGSIVHSLLGKGTRVGPSKELDVAGAA